MSMDEDGRVAYEAICDRAEREANARASHPEGGTCGECSYCRRYCFDECESRSVRDELNAHYGICTETPELPVLVPVDRWVSWEDCWMEDNDGAL